MTWNDQYDRIMALLDSSLICYLLYYHFSMENESCRLFLLVCISLGHSIYEPMIYTSFGLIQQKLTGNLRFNTLTITR